MKSKIKDVKNVSLRTIDRVITISATPFIMTFAPRVLSKKAKIPLKQAREEIKKYLKRRVILGRRHSNISIKRKGKRRYKK